MRRFSLFFAWRGLIHSTQQGRTHQLPPLLGAPPGACEMRASRRLPRRLCRPLPGLLRRAPPGCWHGWGGTGPLHPSPERVGCERAEGKAAAPPTPPPVPKAEGDGGYRAPLMALGIATARWCASATALQSPGHPADCR
jgi:hypothetical protein